MSRGRVTAAAAVAVVALAGCGDHRPGAEPPVTHRPAASPSAAPARPSMTLKPIGTVAISAVEEGSIAVGRDRRSGHDIVVMSTAEGGVDNWNTVTVVDPSAGTSRKVAHSAWSRGLINWVATTGDWVVYVDQSHALGEGSYEALWRIDAVDLVSGTHRTLASSGTTSTGAIPGVGAQEGVVHWAQDMADGSLSELAWKPGARAPYTLIPDARMTGDSTVSGGSVFYVRLHEMGPNGGTEMGDCWRAPLSGGAPVAVTDTGRVTECAARGTHVVWSEHIDPKTPTPPPDGFMDDPYELWTRDWTSDGAAGAPVKLEEGYSQASWLHPTEHALAWLNGSNKIMVTSLMTPSNQIEVPGRVNNFAAGSGDLLAYTHRTRSGIAVTLDRIEVNEP